MSGLASIVPRPARKSPAQLQREINEVLARQVDSEGYRVAYSLITRRNGEIVAVRAIVNAPRPLTLAEAITWRRQWGQKHKAWIETMKGKLVPVPGAKRPGEFVDDARPGDVHASLTAPR